MRRRVKMSYPWGEPQITADERIRRFEQEALFVRDSPRDEDEVSEVGSQMSNPTMRPPTRKRHRGATASASMRSPLPSPSFTPRTRLDRPAKIKSEAETAAIEALLQRPHSQRVKIYVGQNNAMYEVGLEEVQKSPVLKSLVNDNGADGPYIMHPELTKISADFFTSVREFLLIDEYMPAILNNPRGENILPRRLDNCETPGDYRREALRNAHIYVIAKSLGMETMQTLALNKIIYAQYHPYGVECLLNIAMVVFSRLEELGGLGGGGQTRIYKQEHPAEEEEEDLLEKWILEKLVNKFQTMMTTHSRLFFEVARQGACQKRRFEAKVMCRRGALLQTSDPNTITLEDDEDD